MDELSSLKKIVQICLNSINSYDDCLYKLLCIFGKKAQYVVSILIKRENMKCPYCTHTETKVIDKRDFEGITRRRRECLKCGKRYNTHEKVESPELRVVKKDGRREDFSQEKLKRGIIKACEKRPVSGEKIDKMLANIQEKLIKKGKELNSFQIGELVSRELKKIDKVAFIRFASVYKDFGTLDDFKKEIKELVR